jgi:hypothetical protein
MRQSLAESLAHYSVRSFREYITEAGMATVDTPAGGPASHGAIADGIAALSTAGQDMSFDAGAMLAALDRYRKGQRRLGEYGGYGGGVSDAELANAMRRNVRQHVSRGNVDTSSARGAQVGMIDAASRARGGTGIVAGGTDSVLQALGLDPDRVTQTRRAVRRATTDPR